MVVRIIGVVIATLAVACAPTKLVGVTTSYAKTAQTFSPALARVPHVIFDICHKRAELDYIARAQLAPSAATAFEVFYADTGTGHSWQQRCDALGLLGDSVGDLVEHIAKYSRALDRASSAPIDLTDTVSGTVKKIGDALTAVSLVNGTAGQAFSGIAAPLGQAATNIAGRWRAKQLGTLVGRADPQVRALVTVVTHFLDTIESTELTAITLDIEAVRKGLPAGTAAVFVLDMNDWLLRTHRRIEAGRRLTRDLGAAHGELTSGWRGGDSQIATTTQAMDTFALTAADDLRALEEASK